MVAKAKKLQTPCTHAHDSSAHNHAESEKEDSPSVEDVQLLRTERQGCCKKKQEPPPEKKCCKKTQESAVVVHDSPCCKEESTERSNQQRDDSPQISCCHSAKSTPTESQEQIMWRRRNKGFGWRQVNNHEGSSIMSYSTRKATEIWEYLFFYFLLPIFIALTVGTSTVDIIPTANRFYGVFLLLYWCHCQLYRTLKWKVA